jgi:hypothetical protein
MQPKLGRDNKRACTRPMSARSTRLGSTGLQGKIRGSEEAYI